MHETPVLSLTNVHEQGYKQSYSSGGCVTVRLLVFLALRRRGFFRRRRLLLLLFRSGRVREHLTLEPARVLLACLLWRIDCHHTKRRVGFRIA